MNALRRAKSVRLGEEAGARVDGNWQKKAKPVSHVRKQ